jgi:hypothetical protein
MVVHNGWLYVLCSQPSDVSSYVEEAPTERKRFIRVDLGTSGIGSGQWQQLPGPSVVKFTCRLAASIDGIYVVDRSGRVELYSIEESRWIPRCPTGFSVSHPTLYVLPMPVSQGSLLALRTFSSGYRFQFASKSLSLHRLNACRTEWETLERSEIEFHDLLPNGSDGNGGDVSVHGYTISPTAITLRDELDKPRVVYDCSIGDWRLGTMEQEMKQGLRPTFVGNILGSVVHAGRIYCVTESKGMCDGDRGLRPSRLVMYDVVRRRFKALCPAPVDLSGLMCQATLLRSSLELLATRLEDADVLMPQ